MGLNLNEYVEKASLFIKDVAVELGNPEDHAHAGRVITSVFHSLRDRITMEESFHLLAQLPMIIKAVYIEGWNPSRSPAKIKTLEEFLEDVRSRNYRTAGRDFGNDEETKERVEAVFKVIKKYLPKGEIEDIKGQLPKEIMELWEA